jgi:phosphatidylglycerophosphate synthase
VAVAADALGVVRLAAAAAFPGALSQSRPWLPIGLFAVAAASDFLDGPVARRRRPTRHGAVLDNLADIAFVLAATVTAAHLGLVPRAVPAAIAAAFATYALASLARGGRGGVVQLAHSTVGHAAGVLNYALAGLIAGAVAWPGAAWAPFLGVASLVVIAANLAALLQQAARLTLPARPCPRLPR